MDALHLVNPVRANTGSICNICSIKKKKMPFNLFVDNGSDAGAASTVATFDGDHWVLNGAKLGLGF